MTASTPSHQLALRSCSWRGRAVASAGGEGYPIRFGIFLNSLIFAYSRSASSIAPIASRSKELAKSFSHACQDGRPLMENKVFGVSSAGGTAFALAISSISRTATQSKPFTMASYLQGTFGVNAAVLSTYRKYTRKTIGVLRGYLTIGVLLRYYTHVGR